MRLPLALVVLLLAACGEALPSSPPTAPPVTERPSPTPGPSLDLAPVSSTVEGEGFRLTLTVPQRQAITTTALEPEAEFAYIGAEPEITIQTGAPLVVWHIQQVGGTRRMDGEAEPLCFPATLVKDRVITQEFMKMGIATDDATVGFDQAWHSQPQLKLPAGRWEIGATMEFRLDTCDGEAREVGTTVEVEVFR